MAEKTVTLGDIAKFFGYHDNKEAGGLAKFRSDWAKLSTQDKAEIKTGLSDGTLTY